jgi:hypothetical protein
MGILAISFTGMVLILCVLWYQFFTSGNLERRGAIFHIHERLGQQRYEGLEQELMNIIHDRTQAENLSYEAVVARSVIMEFRYGMYDLYQIGEILKEQAINRFELNPEIITHLLNEDNFKLHSITEDVQIAHITHDDVVRPELFILRFGPRAKLNIPSVQSAHTLMFLVVPPKPAGLDLRLAGHITEVMQGEQFDQVWLSTDKERTLQEVLMRDDHYIRCTVQQLPRPLDLSGQIINDLILPETCVLIKIERNGTAVVLTPEATLLSTDEVLIIGEPVDLKALLKPASVMNIEQE